MFSTRGVHTLLGKSDSNPLLPPLCLLPFQGKLPVQVLNLFRLGVSAEGLRGVLRVFDCTYRENCPLDASTTFGGWGTLWAIGSMATVLNDERHVTLVDWLVLRPSGKQEPKTQVLLAESLGVSPRTVRDWMARDDVMARRRELAIQAGGDPERITQVMDALFDQAIDPDSMKQTAAATVWAKMAGVVVPKEDGRSSKAAAQDLRDMGLSVVALQELLAKAAVGVPDNISMIEAN
jgi:hypothetical protein